MNSRVFIIDPLKSWMKIGDLVLFGEIVQVYNGSTYRPSIYAPEEWTQHLIQSFKELNFRSENDHVCLAGGTIQVGLGMAGLICFYEELSLILFRSNERKYIKRWITIDGLLGKFLEESSWIETETEI